MFNVGGMELVVICLVGLIVLGPDKLPGAIRQLGHMMGELRRISQGFQTDFRAAMDQAEREAQAATRGGVTASSTAEGPDPRSSAAEAARAELDAMRKEPAAAVDDPEPGEGVGTEGTDR